MNKSNYLLIAYVGVILSAAFFVVGYWCATVFNLIFGIGGSGSGYQYPWAPYAPGLIMCGIVSLIISALMWRASKATPQPA